MYESHGLPMLNQPIEMQDLYLECLEAARSGNSPRLDMHVYSSCLQGLTSKTFGNLLLASSLARFSVFDRQGGLERLIEATIWFNDHPESS